MAFWSYKNLKFLGCLAIHNIFKKKSQAQLNEIKYNED